MAAAFTVMVNKNGEHRRPCTLFIYAQPVDFNEHPSRQKLPSSALQKFPHRSL